MRRSFWTYQAPEAPDYATLPECVFRGTRDEWESLTPGMRREIVRSALKNKSPDSAITC